MGGRATAHTRAPAKGAAGILAGTLFAVKFRLREPPGTCRHQHAREMPTKGAVNTLACTRVVVFSVAGTCGHLDAQKEPTRCSQRELRASLRAPDLL